MSAVEAHCRTTMAARMKKSVFSSGFCHELIISLFDNILRLRSHHFKHRVLKIHRSEHYQFKKGRIIYNIKIFVSGVFEVIGLRCFLLLFPRNISQESERKIAKNGKLEGDAREREYYYLLKKKYPQ